MPRLALLGSNGMFARDAAPLFRDAGWSVFGGDLPDVDISDAASVGRFLDANPADVLLNAAAYTDVDGAESHPEEARRANALGPAVLAEACACRKTVLVHLSTDYVFPGTRPEGYLPTEPPGPAASAYGRTKLEGEEAIRRVLPADRHLICRTQWLFGSQGKSFPKTILALAQEREQIQVVDDQWGAPTWTRALARQLLRLLEAEARGTRHAAGGGGPVSWFTFAEILLRMAGSPCRVAPCATEAFPRPAPRPRHAWLRDPDEGAWQPWQDGVKEYLAGVSSRPSVRG